MEDRSDHRMVTVDGKEFNWGGNRTDMPEVHDSDLKNSLTSKVEVFDVPTLSWSSIGTTA